MTVDVSKSGNLLLVVTQVVLSVTALITFEFNTLVELFDSNQSLLKVVLESFGSVVLIKAFSGLHVLHVPESCDLSEHVSSLSLNQINVSFKLSTLASQIHDLVTLAI